MLCTGDKNKFDAVGGGPFVLATAGPYAAKVLPALEDGKWVISDRFGRFDDGLSVLAVTINGIPEAEMLEQLYAMTVGKIFTRT